MAEVFLAEQVGAEGFRKRVVIKRLLPKYARNPKVVEMFLNEARLASLIDHPNVVQILDLGQDGHDFYLAMEFLDCRTFADLAERARQRGGRLPLDIALRILADACAGLAWAHDAVDGEGRPIGLIHRDFTPTNIAVTFDGRVKILDFGIAKSTVAPSDTEPGALKGKYAYMSPEMVSGQPFDRRADLFAAGAMLYEMTAGQLPFAGATLQDLLAAISAAQPTPPRALVPALPPPLEDLTLRLLRRAPEERPRTALEVRAELERIIATQAQVVGPVALAAYLRELFPEHGQELKEGQGPPTPAPVAAQATTLTERSRSRSRVFKRLIATGAALAVALVAAASLALFSWRATVAPEPVPAPSADLPVDLGGTEASLVVPGPRLPERPKLSDARAVTASAGGGSERGPAAPPVNPLLSRIYALRATWADGGPRPSPLDGGVPSTVEIGGLQVPIAADQDTLGHRPVQGAVDEAPRGAGRADKPKAQSYDDLLEDRKAGLSSCGSWSPDGRAVKGWLSVEWLVAPDGVPARFKVLEDNLSSPSVERCMVREMASWRFDPPPREAITVRHNFYLMIAARSELSGPGSAP